MYSVFFGGGGLKKISLCKIEISFFQNVELVELITNHHTCNYLSFTVTEIFGFVTSKCIVFLGGLKKIFLSKIEISFFQNVELSELITNHPNCNYLSCTVTEIFGLVTSKCIVFWGRGLKKIFLSKIEISFFQNVELVELITNHPTCIYPSFTVTKIFGLVTYKCIVFLLGVKTIFVKNRNFFF